MAYKTPAWTRKAGKNPKGGLNAKGRASYKGGTLKAPVKSGDNPRRASFLARMGNMKGPEYKNGKPTRLLLSLKAWGASSKADARKKARSISMRNKNKKKERKSIMPTTKASYGEKKTMLKGKQKKLPDALKKRIVASMMKKKKKKSA